MANKAEVRRGALVGPFQDLVIDLSKNAVFTKLAPLPEKSVSLREREELVTRFFAYGDGLDGYRDRPAEFLFQYVKKMNKTLKTDPTLIQKYRRRFVKTMGFVEQAFPFGFRRTAGGEATPRARFEAIAVGSFLAMKREPKLLTKKIDATPWITGDEFGTVIGSDGANAIRRLRRRIEFVRDHLLGA